MSLPKLEYDPKRLAEILRQAREKPQNADELAYLFQPPKYGSWGGGSGIIKDEDYFKIAARLRKKEAARPRRQ